MPFYKMTVTLEMTDYVKADSPEETRKQIEFVRRNLTADKYCCVCANSIDKPDTEMGYPTERCYCSISGEYRDGRSGNACKNWKAKYPQHETR